MSDFREKYCSRHNMIYYDSRCPQCREDDEKQQFDKMIEPGYTCKGNNSLQTVCLSILWALVVIPL